MTVIGVDPGLGGALAYYDKALDYLDIVDMPAYMTTISKKKRKRIDAVDLLRYFEEKALSSVDLVVIEAVGGRPKQSASAGFVFGYTVGLIMMAAITTRIPIQTVDSAVWKRMMKVRGGKFADENAIMERADDWMPRHRDKWRGPQGGRRLDRAEAAMIAYYGETYCLDRGRPHFLTVTEMNMVYRKAIGDAD